MEELDLDSWRLDELLKPLSDWKPIKDHIFDCFLVLGLPSDSRPKSLSLPAQVLYTYPKGDNYGKQLLPYCFHDSKVPLESIDRRGSMSELNKILFWQTSLLQSAEHSCVFHMSKHTLLGEDKKKKPLYAICVYNRELVKDKLSFVTNVASPVVDPRVQLKGGDFDYVAPRCYVLLSRYPFFKIHFDVLYTILAREQMRRTCRRAKAKIPPGNEISEFLAVFHDSKIPKVSDMYNVKLPGSDEAIKFVYFPDEQWIINWFFPSTFHALSVENFITIFNALLLENSVIITSRSPGITTAIAYTLNQIISYFGWAGIFEPLVDGSLIKQFPLKFLAGVREIPLDVPSDALLVYADDNRVVVPSDAKIFPLPDKEKLSEPLVKPAQTIKKSTKLNHLDPYKATEADTKEAKVIYQQFVEFQNHIKTSIFGPLAAKKIETVGKHKDKVLPLLDKKQRDWYKAFMSTRTFEAFWPTENELKNKKNTLTKSNSKK